MIMSVQKVAHYEVNLNLSQMEFEVLKSIMSNLKENEVLEASGYRDCITETKTQVLKAYGNLKWISNCSIKVGKE